MCKELTDSNIPFTQIHANKMLWDLTWYRHLSPRDFPIVYITLRNPISRFISAYYWRQKLCQNEQTRNARQMRERELLLSRCPTLASYVDNLHEHDGYRVVGHIRKDITFYLRGLLRRCPADRIRVICCETVGEDMQRFFNIALTKHEHNNGNHTDTALDAARRAKLRRYLASEYRCVETLRKMGALTPTQYAHLSR